MNCRERRRRSRKMRWATFMIDYSEFLGLDFEGGSHSQAGKGKKFYWFCGTHLSAEFERPYDRVLSGCGGFHSCGCGCGIFYENVKEYVQEAYGARNAEREDHNFQDSKQLFDRTKMKRMLLSRLDALNNKGLYLIAMLLAGGSVKFKTTCKKMKEAIKQAGFLRDQSCNHDQTEILMLLDQLINSPQYFRENCLMLLNPTFQSHHSAALQVLDGLEDLPTEALLAMRRKLSNTPASIPYIQKKKYNRSRDRLIDYVRKTSEKMLSELGRGDELQAPLAKSLAMAGLSLKLTTGSLNSSVADFNQFSPEIKALQDEISKAIRLLGMKKLKIPEVHTLQLLLDPKADVPKGSLRTAMTKLLTEYLFECSEFHIIPKPLTEALAIINRSSCQTRIGFYPKEQIEEEVECILGLSSEIKQMVWDVFPEHEFDKDFTDAYVEELEESDSGDDDDYVSDHLTVAGGDDDHQHMELRKPQSGKSYSIGLNYPEESCGEYIPMDSSPPISNPETSCDPTLFHETRYRNGMHNVDGFSLHHSPNGSTNSHSTRRRNEPERDTASDPGNSLEVLPSTFYMKGAKFMPNQQNISGNLYLGIQEVCDETSVVAYNLIGYIMEGLAWKEGLGLRTADISYLRGDKSSKENQDIAQVFEELLPSLPKRYVASSLNCAEQ
ncbi:unnamed protein product [Dovyalis caffra]|uniref:Uncharacterized protein n=1 Tax=Dovyalis caffra TaxID=77055 RepID=A0AAV1QPA1_9ROSI|nr:unnamed protein product [Dovyalis caffra]